jgi:hypothetical protein
MFKKTSKVKCFSKLNKTKKKEEKNMLEPVLKY